MKVAAGANPKLVRARRGNLARHVGTGPLYTSFFIQVFDSGPHGPGGEKPLPLTAGDFMSKGGDTPMENKIEAVTLATEAIDMNEVETMEEAFAASSIVTVQR
jgi:hypothetical protein